MILYDRDATFEIIKVVGDIDEASAPHLDFALDLDLIPGETPLSIDLSRCNLILAVGLSVLVKAANERGDKLTIRVVENGRVDRILKMTRLNDLLSIVYI